MANTNSPGSTHITWLGCSLVFLDIDGVSCTSIPNQCPRWWGHVLNANYNIKYITFLLYWVISLFKKQQHQKYEVKIIPENLYHTSASKFNDYNLICDRPQSYMNTVWMRFFIIAKHYWVRTPSDTSWQSIIIIEAGSE